MKTLALPIALTLAACGGAPFTISDSLTASLEAGDGAAQNAPGDGAFGGGEGETDAGGGSEGSTDARSERQTGRGDAQADAGGGMDAPELGDAQADAGPYIGPLCCHDPACPQTVWPVDGGVVGGSCTLLWPGVGLCVGVIEGRACP